MKLSTIFTNEQLVYHISEAGTWIGQFDMEQDGIVYDGEVYKSLCAFARAHTGKPCSGWKECFVEHDGEIIQAVELKHIMNFHKE
jgi:hypothetical protein